jgi:hypothetical protein
MTPRFLDPAYRRHFAAEAAAQRDARARVYPEMIAAGRIGREEAEADWRAWVALALWCDGRRIGFDIAWAAIAAAAGRAIAQGERSAAARPDDAALARRREAVAEIARLAEDMHAFVAALNAALRADAKGRAAA